MMIKSRMAAVALAIAAISGVGVTGMQAAYAAPMGAVVNLTNESIPAGATIKQVESAVLQALTSRNWTIKDHGAGSVDAQYARTDAHSNFSADITVTYTASSFSVVYKNSTGLDYNAATGRIHANYNKWITNLKFDIQRNVSNALAASAPK